ncbi:MAG TPA: AIR synthase family protein [archaeon]|nr:AIR synthase family protein [archaeon]
MAGFGTGKLPAEFLDNLLRQVPLADPRVIVSGRLGEDAAVIEFGDRYLLAKSDPITFATDRPGWYAVQVNANDIAAMGGTCRWFLATLLLPEGRASEELVSSVFTDISSACRELEIQLVGGHTEITYGLKRTIVSGLMLGEASRDRLCSKDRIAEGDSLLLTKALAVEGTSLIAREFADRLKGQFSREAIARAADFLYDPGISVVREARTAVDTGYVHAMHDPTEGGLAAALHELASAADKGLVLHLSTVPLYRETQEFCSFFGLDPLGLIASGSLLIACPPEGAKVIIDTLEAAGTPCVQIGEVVGKDKGLTEIEHGKRKPLRRIDRDEICRLFG